MLLYNHSSVHPNVFLIGTVSHVSNMAHGPLVFTIFHIFTVIFDPASFYGHSEYDLAIAKMFGGFSSSFFDCYHKVIPQSAGFRKRTDLYKLFHYLNHWLVNVICLIITGICMYIICGEEMFEFKGMHPLSGFYTPQMWTTILCQHICLLNIKSTNLHIHQKLR